MFFPFSKISKKLSECNVKKLNNPLKKTKYKKGYTFDPVKGMVTFDSGLEEKYFKKLNLAGVKWERNETLSIEYISPVDGKTHKYIPDLFVYKNNMIYIQEVKPSFQVNDPVVQAKAKAAIKLCEKKGWIYEFVTEKEINSK